MNTINVVCAVMIHDNKVLAVKRGKDMSHSGQWEFPGGKIEENESEKEALIREIKEELTIEVVPERKLATVEYAYPNRTIILLPWICTSSEYSAIELSEHEIHQWCTVEELLFLHWCEADIPVVKEIVELLTVSGSGR